MAVFHIGKDTACGIILGNVVAGGISIDPLRQAAIFIIAVFILTGHLTCGIIVHIRKDLAIGVIGHLPMQQLILIDQHLGKTIIRIAAFPTGLGAGGRILQGLLQQLAGLVVLHGGDAIFGVGGDLGTHFRGFYLQKQLLTIVAQ